MEVQVAEHRSTRVRRAKEWYDVQEVLSIDQARELLPLFEEMHAENAPNLAFDGELLLRKMTPYIVDVERQWHNIWAAYREGEPVGFIVGTVTEFWFSRDKMLENNDFWFVTRKLRGSPVALLLLRQLLQWAALRGVVRYVIGSIHPDGRNNRAFDKMASKLGFRPMGAYYVKDI
jgi:Acetyltransferase (GNAT) family